MLPNATPSPAELNAIYTPQWRERVEHYWLHSRQRERCSGYWAFNIDRSWAKHRTAVPREVVQARTIARWMEPEGRSVLIIGCALGDEAIAWALLGARVTAIDLDPEAVQLSVDLAQRWKAPLDARVMDACDTGFPDESFDFVSCAQVLEHLPPQRQETLLRELWRLCRTDGLVWVDTPNQLNYKDRHDTGLPFIHWLPRRLKLPLARRLGRHVPTREPAFGYEEVAVHYFLSYFGLKRILNRLGPYEILSRYHGFADMDHYRQVRALEGRDGGAAFAIKVATMRLLLRVASWNWLSNMRLVIRKRPGGVRE